MNHLIHRESLDMRLKNNVPSIYDNEDPFFVYIYEVEPEKRGVFTFCCLVAFNDSQSLGERLVGH